MATKVFDVFGEIDIKGGDGSVRKLKDVTGEAKKTSTVTTAALAAMATAAVAYGVASVKAYAESEVSGASLRASVEATGQAYEDLAATLDGTVSEAMRTSAYDDELLQDALTVLIQTTGSTETAMERLSLVTDIARGRKMQLVDAATLVGKVEGGNLGILSRYGIQLDKNATSTEALALLQERYAGQAVAYANSTKGGMERATVALENLKEAFGEGIVGDAGDDVGDLVDSIERLEPIAEGVGVAVHGIADALGFVADIGAATGYNIVWLLDAIGMNVDLAGAKVAAFGDDYKVKILGCQDATDGLTVSTGAASAGIQDVGGVTGELADETSDAAEAQDELTRAMDGTMVAADSMSGKMRTLTELDLAQRTADLNLTEAQQRLQTVMADGTSSAEDIARAQLGVEKAELAAKDAAYDMGTAIDETLGTAYDNTDSITSINAVAAALQAAMIKANNLASAARNALSIKYGATGTNTGGALSRHGGGVIDVSGSYSLQKGEMVLRETQVERLIDNGGSVTQSANVVIIADPRYTDMARLENDVRRVNSGDVASGGILAALGIG